jgi:ribosomal protein S21
MAVIVHENENIESALKRLYREVMRERILEEARDRQYRITKAELEREKRREWKKRKKRRRAARRRMKN